MYERVRVISVLQQGRTLTSRGSSLWSGFVRICKRVDERFRAPRGYNLRRSQEMQPYLSRKAPRNKSLSLIVTESHWRERTIFYY